MQKRTTIRRIRFGDPDPIANLANVMQRLGFDAADIETLKTGDDAAITAAYEKYNGIIQKGAEDRIRETVKKTEAAQIAKGIYTRNQAAIIEAFSEFGLSADVLKDVEENKQYSVLVEKAREAARAKIAEAADAAKNADAPKLLQLQKQLEKADKELQETLRKYNDLEQDVPKRVQAKIDEKDVETAIQLEAVKDTKDLTLTNADALIPIIEGFMRRDGVRVGIERDGNKTSYVILNADGNYYPVSGSNKNHTLQTYIKDVYDRAMLVKKSNADPLKNPFNLPKIDDESMKHIHPDALAAIQAMK